MVPGATRAVEHEAKGQTPPPDLVARQFEAPAPNRLWVADLTYVKTHTGWVYVAFIVDVHSRFVVGWQASRSLRSDLAIDALEMAVFNRRRVGADLTELIHHSDRGVQYLSVRYSSRLAENDIVASVGSKGDSYGQMESFWARMQVELLTGNDGTRASSWPTRSSSTLRSSTTGNAGTRRSGCSARSSTSVVTPTTQPAIKQADRANPRAHKSSHATRGDSLHRSVEGLRRRRRSVTG